MGKIKRGKAMGSKGVGNMRGLGGIGHLNPDKHVG